VVTERDAIRDATVQVGLFLCVPIVVVPDFLMIPSDLGGVSLHYLVF
jgi:hypothetical protein